MTSALTPLQRSLVDQYTAVRPTYEAFTEALRERISDLFVREGIMVVRVDGRAKAVDSLAGKFARYPQTTALEEFPDLAGVRIVIIRPDDIVHVRQFLYREFAILEQEYHGDDASDTFGYRGLHLEVRMSDVDTALAEWAQFDGLKAEVQVHTALEYAWAMISHDLSYKAREHVPARMRRLLFRIAALLETSDELLVQFCREVEDLQAEYREAIEKGELDRVPLDAESIRMIWPELARLLSGSDSPLESALDGARVERFLDLFELCGIENLDELHRRAKEAAGRAEAVNQLLATASAPTASAPAELLLAIDLLMQQPGLQDDAHLWVGPEYAAALRTLTVASHLEP